MQGALPQPEDNGLNDRQEAFVRGIVVGMPTSAAYKAAGYTATGNDAGAAASKMARNNKVRLAHVCAREEQAGEQVSEGQKGSPGLIRKAIEVVNRMERTNSQAS